MCSRKSHRVRAHTFCWHWRAAIETDGQGRASVQEVQVVTMIANLILLVASDTGRKGAHRNKKNAKSTFEACNAKAGECFGGGSGAVEDGVVTCAGRTAGGIGGGPHAGAAGKGESCVGAGCGKTSLAVSGWLHGLMQLLPQRRFFESVAMTLALAGPGALGRLSEHLDFLGTMDDKPTDRIPYRTLLTAVAVAAGKDTDADPSDNVWVAETLALLDGAEASRGLTCEAFVCATLGRRSSKVSLHLYNLSNSAERFVGRMMLGMDGVWHSGVAVHGFEYWYSGPVHRCRAARTPFGTPEAAVTLGHTLCSPRQVLVMVRKELLPRFAADSYDVLKLNCNDFCDALSLLVVGHHIPSTIRLQADRAMESTLVRWVQPMARGWTSVHSAAPIQGSQLPRSSIIGEGATSEPSSMLALGSDVDGGGAWRLDMMIVSERPKTHRADEPQLTSRSERWSERAAMRMASPRALETLVACAANSGEVHAPGTWDPPAAPEVSERETVETETDTEGDDTESNGGTTSSASSHSS